MLYSRICRREPIHKGWSGDQKFQIYTAEGETYLLRIAPGERYARKKQEFDVMQKIASLGIPMCQSLEFGTCAEGVYTILSWVEGEDAEEQIPRFPERTQYALGLQAGQILSKIHSIPAPADTPDWEQRFQAKIDRKLQMYADCPLKYRDDAPFLAYLTENRHLLANRPQSIQHGDYHVGNLMLTRDGRLVVIDFEKMDVGDPWEEFNRIVWSAQAAPAFARGMVDGYFDREVPLDFWRLLALYICSNCLGSLPWAIPFGEQEVQVMRRQAEDILRWYDRMERVVPAWYHNPI